MKKFAALVIRLRLVIVIISVLITMVMAWFLKDLKINPDIVTYLPKEDSVVSRFNYIGDVYSGSSMGIVIVHSDSGVFTSSTIKHVNELTNELKMMEGVNFVTSLTQVLDIKKTADGLETGRLIDEYQLPETAEQLKALKDYILSKKMYKGRLVSGDGKYTLIVCRISHEKDKNQVAKEIKEMVLSKNYPEKFYFEGIPFQFMSIMDYVLKDLSLLIPLIVLVIGIALLLSFRSLRMVLLPLISVAMGIVWSMGLMGVFGVMLTPVSDAIPVVLFAVGSAYGIHVVSRFKLRVVSAEHKKEQCRQALSEVGTAVLLAGITTFAGFLSFIFGAYLNVISDFGIFSALGVLFILIISITFIPAVLSYFPVPKQRMQNDTAPRRFDLLSRLMNTLSNVAIKRKKTVIIISIALIVLMAGGIPLIKNKIDILNYFRPQTDIRISADVMNREFGGSLPIQIIVRGDIQEPVTLEKMKKIQTFLDAQPDVKNAQSVADFIEEMNDCMGEGKRIPDSRDKVSNLWFLLEGEEMLSQMVNYDKTEAIIQANIVNVDTKRYHELYNSLNDFIAVMNDGQSTVVQTGLPAIYSNFDDSLMKNLLQSMILAFLLILICMIFLIKSFKAALVGMIPLSFTMIVVFGFMGYAGIALDIATVLIASITVGAGIDYAIHFITEYKNQMKRGMEVDDAIKNTIKISGKSIIINVITIILGFLILVFANLLPLVNFGILIAICMFFSGLGAVTLLPSVISTFKMKMIKKNINK